ncbi:pyridoxal-phosphate dependent enzyme [Noviherbaspirillum saxi]|uniref:L-serine ammonia-lyase n=1 Tax=Noviherbaspirillum saxi TaxID=2320863 RepID=A0A3A3FMK9_9BURK|nr:pyridoxal-phosphate dependent enzyme [Noviherbaspirillum saxi]RJF97133.1 pyridoxal-phosphate dependent enzyme [Noviherbaspirillum saxi]
MTSLHLTTPLLTHRSLSAAIGKRVLLKMENLQPSGSFKMRGIGLFCQRAAERGARHFVCPSGGNAGFAAAVAGVELGVRTTIIVPGTTHESVRLKIRAIGADVLVHGDVWDESNQRALQLCEQEGAVYVPPFDHRDIWDGNATLIDEVVAADADFDAVICSVGGGGLLCGVLEGLHRNGLGHVPVLAVETEGADSLHAAMQAGDLVSLPDIKSIATTLGAKCVARQAFEWTRRHDVRSIVVSDAQAVSACRRFADDMRMLVEPACGAALSVVYHCAPALAPFEKPLVVVCGGIGVDLAKLEAWKIQFER